MQDLAGAAPLLAAINATEPVAAPITLFAPNNAAFESISTVVAGLSSEEVLAVLANHVAPTELDSAAVTAAIEAASPNPAGVTTLGGKMLEVSLMTEDIVVAPKDSDVMAMVVVTDVQTCAGVVHVIDEVLVPAADAAVAPAPAAEAAAPPPATTTEPTTTISRSASTDTPAADATGTTSGAGGVAGTVMAVAVAAAVAAF